MKNALITSAIILAASFAVGRLHAQTATSTAAFPSSIASIKIPILVYHSIRPYYPGITDLVKEFTVPPDIFDDQLKYLRDNGFTAVTADQLRSALVNGTPLPSKPFLITLDDGWRNQFTYAFPILKKYNDPAVFYVYSGVIGNKAFLTWDEVDALATSSMTIGGHTEWHPELPKVSGNAALAEEVSGSRKIIEAHVHEPVDHFAYPYGEFDTRVVQAVEDAGYKSARALRTCGTETQSDLFTLCGIIITGDFNRFVSLVNR